VSLWAGLVSLSASGSHPRRNLNRGGKGKGGGRLGASRVAQNVTSPFTSRQKLQLNSTYTQRYPDRIVNLHPLWITRHYYGASLVCLVASPPAPPAFCDSNTQPKPPNTTTSESSLSRPPIPSLSGNRSLILPARAMGLGTTCCAEEEDFAHEETP